HHAVDDVAPALLHLRRGVAVRLAELGGLLDRRRQERRLGGVQLTDVLAVVGLRRRLDAVGLASEVDGVEVLLHHPLLVLGLVHLEGDDDLLELPGDGLLLADALVVVADHLLGDGGAALHLLSGDGGDRAAYRAAERDAGLVPEAAVLRGDHRLLDHLRDLVVLDRVPVHTALGELRLAVGVVEGRPLVDGLGLGAGGHLEHRVGDGESGDPQPQHGQDRDQGGADDPEPERLLGLGALLPGPLRTARPAGLGPGQRGPLVLLLAGGLPRPLGAQDVARPAHRPRGRGGSGLRTRRRSGSGGSGGSGGRTRGGRGGGEARAGPFGLLPVLALVPPHTVPGRSGAERRGGVPGSGVRRGAAAVRPLGVHGVGGLGGLGTAPHGPVVIVVIGEDRSERSGRRPFGTVVPGLGARLAVGPPAGGVRVLRGGLVPGLLLLSGALGTGAVLNGEDRSERSGRRPFGTVVPGLGARLAVGPPAGGVR